MLAFALEALAGGVDIVLATELLEVTRQSGVRRVSTSRGEVSCRWLINAAGVSADLIDTACGHGDFRVQPRRGELLVFDKSAREIVNSIILPVPSATTKGVVVRRPFSETSYSARPLKTSMTDRRRGLPRTASDASSLPGSG